MMWLFGPIYMVPSVLTTPAGKASSGTRPRQQAQPVKRGACLPNRLDRTAE